MPRMTTRAGKYRDFGKELKRYRRAADLTQVEASRRAGIADSYFGLLENGIYQPTPRVLSDICRVLDADYNFLAGKLGWIRPTGADPLAEAVSRADPETRDLITRLLARLARESLAPRDLPMDGEANHGEDVVPRDGDADRKADTETG